MGSTEILIYVCAASLALGFLICWLAFVIPAQRDNEALRIRNTARGLQQIRDVMDALEYRHQLRQETHKGTPYISSPATDLEKVLVGLEDNERWSRKAELRAVDS